MLWVLCGTHRAVGVSETQSVVDVSRTHRVAGVSQTHPGAYPGLTVL